MGFDTSLFVLPVDENFVCDICCGVLEKPTIACVNSHAFCAGCIQMWSKKSKNCPGCRVPMVPMHERHVIRPMESITMKLNVRCPQKDEDDHHDKENSAAPTVYFPATKRSLRSNGLKAINVNVQLVKAPTKTCGWHGLLSDYVEKHKCQECEFAKGPCSLCSMTMGVRDIDDHQKNDCLRRIILCDLCNESFQACNMPNHKAHYCVEREVSCEHCGEMMPWKNLGSSCANFDKPQLVTFTGHQRKCPKRHIPCEFATHGCNTKMRREKMPAHLASAMGTHMGLISAAATKDWKKIGFVWNFPECHVDKMYTHKEVRSKKVELGGYAAMASLLYDDDRDDYVRVKISVIDQKYRPMIDRVKIQVGDHTCSEQFEWAVLSEQRMYADGTWCGSSRCSTTYTLKAKAPNGANDGMALEMGYFEELFQQEGGTVKISVSFRLSQPECVLVGTDV